MWSRESKGACPSILGPRPAHPTPSGPGTAPPPAPTGTLCLPGLLRGRGVWPVARRPGPRFRVLLAWVPLALAVAMQYVQAFLLLLLLLAMSAPSQAWSRPLWYQVGLDLQPWGCQPSSLDGCGVSLGCPGQWLGLGMNPIYSVTGVMLTSAMMLMVGRKVLQRRCPQGARSEVRACWSPSLLPGPTPSEPVLPPPTLPPTSLLPTSAGPLLPPNTPRSIHMSTPIDP